MRTGDTYFTEDLFDILWCRLTTQPFLQADATKRQTRVVKVLEARVRTGEASLDVLASEQSALAAMTEQLTTMTSEFRTLYRGCVSPKTDPITVGILLFMTEQLTTMMLAPQRSRS